MKRMIKTLITALSLSVAPLLIATATAQDAPVKAVPMPPERAKAMLDDERVKSFLSVVEKELSGKCQVLDAGNVMAKLNQKGSGDFSSSFYEVSIPCSGKDGLDALQITAEFSPPLGTPLNLLLAIHFKR